MFTPERIAHRRIHGQCLSNYVTALEVTIRDFVTETIRPACDIQFEILLRPDALPLICLQYFGTPKWKEEELLQLKQLLAEVPAPVVTGGCVGLVLRQKVREGATHPPQFDVPFSLLDDVDEYLVRSLVAEAGGVNIPPSELNKFYFEKPTKRARGFKGILASVSKFLGRLPKVELVERFDPDEPLYPSIQSEEQIKLVEGWLSGNVEPNRISPGTLAEYYQLLGDHENAGELFSMLVALAPLDERSYVARAKYFLATNRLSQGLTDLEKAISINSNFGTALYLRASVFAELGGSDKALAEAAEILSNRPYDVLTRMLRLQILMNSNRLAEADSESEILLRYDPNWPDAIGRFAYLQRSKFPNIDIQALIVEVERGLRIAPGHLSLSVERIRLLLTLQKWVEALADCDQLIEKVGDNTFVRELRALAYYELGDYQRSLADCEFTLENDPANQSSMLLRAMNFANSGDLDQALADAIQVLVKDPENIDALILKGEIGLLRQQSVDSLACFDKAAELAPQFFVAHRGKGRSLGQLGRFEEAAESFRRAIELDANQADCHFFLGLCQRLGKDYVSALESMNRADQLGPEVLHVMWERARLLGDLNCREECLAVLNRLLEIAPDFPQAIEYRASLHEQNKNFELAEQDWDQLVRMFPDFEDGFMRRGVMWELAGNQSLAAREFEYAENLHPERASEFRLQQGLARALACIEASRLDEAITVLTSLLEITSLSVPALTMRATAYWYDEHYAEAIDDYTRALELSSGNGLDILSARGQVYSELGEFELAIADLNQVLDAPGDEVTPNLIGYALNGRGFANAGCGDFEGAAEDFRQAIKICPQNAWLHYNQGRMYLLQNRKDEAVTCFSLALSCRMPPLTAKQRAKATALVKSFAES